MENIVFGQIYEEDLKQGVGTDLVTLPDSSTANLHRIGLQTFTGIANVKNYGAVGDGTNDDTAAIQAAIDSWTNGNGAVFLPPGNYKVTSTLTIAHDRVTLFGAGTYASQILFAPTANDTCIEVQHGTAAVQFQNVIRDLSLYSNDATYIKVGIDLVDVSTMIIHNIFIGGGIQSGNTFYWDDNSNSCIGVRTNGREALDASNWYITASKPVYIAKNPNATVPTDHFHFMNMNLVANQNPVIEVQDGVNITNMTFDGYQAWVRGTYGFKWVDTTNAFANYALHFSNVRWEQVQGTTGYFFYLNLRAATPCYNFTLTNIFGETVNEANGFYLRAIRGALLNNVWYTGDQETLNVDNTCLSFTFWNFFIGLVGSTMTTTGFTEFVGRFIEPTQFSAWTAFGTFQAANELNLGNSAYIGAEVAAGGTSFPLIGRDASDRTAIDHAAGVTVVMGRLLVNTTANFSHTLVIPNIQNYGGMNAAGSDSIPIVHVDASDKLQFDASAVGAQFGGFVQPSNAGKIRGGNGSPEGVVVGLPGDIWQRLDGGAGTSFYVKESGVGNTGWVGK